MFSCVLSYHFDEQNCVNCSPLYWLKILTPDHRNHQHNSLTHLEVVVVAEHHTALLTGEQDLQQFAIGVIVTDVGLCHSWGCVQVAQATDGQQCAEVVVPKHHCLHKLETAAGVSVEEVLLPTWQEHVRWL